MAYDLSECFAFMKSANDTHKILALSMMARALQEADPQSDLWQQCWSNLDVQFVDKLLREGHSDTHDYLENLSNEKTKAEFGSDDYQKGLQSKDLFRSTGLSILESFLRQNQDLRREKPLKDRGVSLLQCLEIELHRSLSLYKNADSKIYSSAELEGLLRQHWSAIEIAIRLIESVALENRHAYWRGETFKHLISAASAACDLSVYDVLQAVDSEGKETAVHQESKSNLDKEAMVSDAEPHLYETSLCAKVIRLPLFLLTPDGSQYAPSTLVIECLDAFFSIIDKLSAMKTDKDDMSKGTANHESFSRAASKTRLFLIKQVASVVCDDANLEELESSAFERILLRCREILFENYTSSLDKSIMYSLTRLLSMLINKKGARWVFKVSSTQNSEIERSHCRFLLLTSSLSAASIRGLLPSVIPNLNKTDIDRINRWLMADLIIVRSVLLLVCAEPSEEHPTVSNYLFPDDFVRYRRDLLQLFSDIIEFMRDRYDQAISGALGLHPEAIHHGPVKELRWDSSEQNLEENDIFYMMVASLCDFIANDEESLNGEVCGIVVVLIFTYKNSIQYAPHFSGDIANGLFATTFQEPAKQEWKKHSEYVVAVIDVCNSAIEYNFGNDIRTSGTATRDIGMFIVLADAALDTQNSMNHLVIPSLKSGLSVVQKLIAQPSDCATEIITYFQVLRHASLLLDEISKKQHYHLIDTITKIYDHLKTFYGRTGDNERLELLL